MISLSFIFIKNKLAQMKLESQGNDMNVFYSFSYSFTVFLKFTNFNLERVQL